MTSGAQISLRMPYYHIIPTKLHYNTHTRAYKTNTHTTINEDTRPSMLLISTYTRNTYVSTGTQQPAAQPHSPHEMGLFPLELTYSTADPHFPLEIWVFRVPKPIVLHTIYRYGITRVYTPTYTKKT